MLQIETLKASLHRAETELRKRDTEVRKSTEAERNMAAHLRYQVSKLSADKEKLQVSGVCFEFVTRVFSSLLLYCMIQKITITSLVIIALFLIAQTQI